MNKPGEFGMITPPLPYEHPDRWKWKRWRWDDETVTDNKPDGDWVCTCGVFECDHIAYLRSFTDSMAGIVRAIVDNPGAESVEYNGWKAEPMP